MNAKLNFFLHTNRISHRINLDSVATFQTVSGQLVCCPGLPGITLYYREEALSTGTKYYLTEHTTGLALVSASSRARLHEKLGQIIFSYGSIAVMRKIERWVEETAKLIYFLAVTPKRTVYHHKPR